MLTKEQLSKASDLMLRKDIDSIFMFVFTPTGRGGLLCDIPDTEIMISALVHLAQQDPAFAKVLELAHDAMLDLPTNVIDN